MLPGKTFIEERIYLEGLVVGSMTDSDESMVC